MIEAALSTIRSPSVSTMTLEPDIPFVCGARCSPSFRSYSLKRVFHAIIRSPRFVSESAVMNSFP